MAWDQSADSPLVKEIKRARGGKTSLRCGAGAHLLGTVCYSPQAEAVKGKLLDKQM